MTEPELIRAAQYVARLPEATPTVYSRVLALGVLDLIDQRDRLNRFILEMAERYSKQSAALTQAAMRGNELERWKRLYGQMCDDRNQLLNMMDRALELIGGKT